MICSSYFSSIEDDLGLILTDNNDNYIIAIIRGPKLLSSAKSTNNKLIYAVKKIYSHN